MLFDRTRIPGLLLLATALACWPIGSWYCQHLGDSPDDAIGVAALVLLFALSCRRRAAPTGAARSFELLPSTLALAAYAISFPFVPRLVSAVLAFLALGFSGSLWRHGTPFRPWAVGLSVLGLPMASSLQFYLGYPLRVASAVVALVFLRAGGISVILEGVTLRWGETPILVDAPCSGVKMMWAGQLLGCCLATLLGVGGRASLLVLILGAAALLAVLGNGLRTAGLFLADTSLPDLPTSVHGGIGASVFCLMALGLVVFARAMARRAMARKEQPCAPSA